MSDKPEWKGGRIGPYEIGKRYPGIAEEEGRLYEARHLETGEPALAVMPGTDEDWRTSQPWDVRTTNFVRPEVLMVHPRRRPGPRAPGFPRPRSPMMRWGLACASVALSAALVFLLWPRSPEYRESHATSVEPIMFSDGQDLSAPAIAYPMPEKPFSESPGFYRRLPSL